MIDEAHGTAASLHAWVPDLARPAMRLAATSGPALVLGSTQAADDLDAEGARRLGYEVTRRRSGGGVVELGPSSVWVDVIVPADDPRHDDDIGRAASWMGATWAAALTAVSPQLAGSVSVHHGRPVAAAEGRIVCFAGVGAGEVLLGGRKVVGVSQRRTRAGTWFQCVLYRSWDPAALLSLLAVPAGLAATIAQRCADAVAAVDGSIIDEALVELQRRLLTT